jgi:hypothetical protein
MSTLAYMAANKEYFGKLNALMALVALTSCVDKIYFDAPRAQPFTIVEGMISDSPGPYTVKVSKSLSIIADSSVRDPIQNAKIQLRDDEGNVEDLAETSPGIYVTGGVIQGRVGHAYSLLIETDDGKIFESEPDTIKPVGEIDSIKYQFEARKIQLGYVAYEADVFNILVDAKVGKGSSNYVRWRFTGIYKAITHPEFHFIYLQGYKINDPYPCSGYVAGPLIDGNHLVQVDSCTCCICWVTQYEPMPTVSDGQFISNNEFRNVKVAEVPINIVTFDDKYLVQIEQMSLSKNAFDFFKLIRIQKDQAASLFQPPFGTLKGNISSRNANEPVVGLFWATSTTIKRIFIPRSAAPDYLGPTDADLNAPCQRIPSSTTTQPDFWQ